MSAVKYLYLPSIHQVTQLTVRHFLETEEHFVYSQILPTIWPQSGIVKGMSTMTLWLGSACAVNTFR